MKPKNLSEVKSQDEFLEYLIDNYYYSLGEGSNLSVKVAKSGAWLQVNKGYITLWERLDEEATSGKLVTVVQSTTTQDYKDKIKALRNKPSFEDHPDAKCFVQNPNGCWYKNTKTDSVLAKYVQTGWTVKNLIDCHSWALVNQGKVIGDWKQTFEKAPEKQDSTEYAQSVNDIIAQYMTSYMNHACENKRQQDEIEYLEEQIAELKSENQELKTKIDRTKQALS